MNYQYKKFFLLNTCIFATLLLFFILSPAVFTHEFEGHTNQNIEDYPDIDHEKNIFHPKNKKLLEDGSPLKLWIESENIGKLLDLHFTKTLHLTIPVNIIFVGFGGEGNRAVNLTQEELLEWFSHIEHSIKNVIVPIGEDYVTTDKSSTPSTHIEYSFDLQVSKLDPMVNTLVEDAIFWHLRSETDDDYNQNGVNTYDDQKEEIEKKFYTNPYLVSSLLSSLCDSLNLNDNSYTVFILNPNHPSTADSGHIYGYRTGFSNSELKKLYRNPDIKIPQEISVSTDYEFSQLLKDKNTNNNNKREDEDNTSIKHSNNNKNIKYKDLVNKSSEWANAMIKEFNQFRTKTTQTNPNCKYESPDGDEDRWYCMSMNMIKNESSSTIVERAQDIFESGTLFEQLYVYTAHQFQITENPIVDTWISHKRFSFIDLTAGPFEWGPSIKGNGLKTFSTLPVPPFPLMHEEKIESLRTELKKMLLTQDKMDQESLMLTTVFTNNCPAHLEITDIDTITKELHTPDLDPQSVNTYQLCLTLAEKYKKVSEKNLEDIDLLLGNLEEDFGDNTNQDVFISKLGAVVSSSLRHLVAPPLPLFRIRFAQRVNFQVYVISDHQVYNPRDYFYFNYEHFKNEVEKLKLPNQEFTFTIKSINMGQDKSLALAYQTSLKTNLSPIITENGEFTTRLNYYLDSKDIKNHLVRLLHLNNDQQATDDNEENIYQYVNPTEAKYIPIFLFSLSSSQPVFIDKNQQAKSLSNMVIAVQTNVLSYPSSFSANGQQTSLYLLNPTSSILAATALNLGGLVGTHFTYSEAHQAATSNWHFSVGDSPLSKTFSFPFSYFNDFQKDIIFRNYVVSSLERSLYWINKATSMLIKQKTTVNNFPTLMTYPLEDITLNFVGIRDLWSQSSNYLSQLNFQKAIQTAQESEQNAYKFYKESVALVQFATLSSCNQINTSTFSIPKRTVAIVIITFGINFIIIVLLSIFYKKKTKLKIN
ncbi:hypothetical protein CYY_003890 [Polysphondylium violaceum]|uniref:DUF7906 domain-containing protein n=1 Tax=Polysphondylium violaceum TaxID=133409 RepID=A0A8J4PYC5_9MYCE|nr:hypothetical protein CYY_003890 [Polysphondylium violaceum]